MTEKEKSKGVAKRAEERPATVEWSLVERLLASENVARIHLSGPPGIGKTYVAYRYGRTQRGVYACTLTQETPSAELRGTYLPRGEEIVWHDGPVILAMRQGARLVLNELSNASDDALAFLHPVLEHEETARLTLPTGETVAPAPGFHVVVTDNGSCDTLPPALRDRFDVRLEVGEAHPAALDSLSPALREVARRSLGLDEDRRVSVRAWRVLERLRHELGLELACIAIFGVARGAHIRDALRLAGAA